MTQTIDITGLTAEQIEQIQKMVETFKTINQRSSGSSVASLIF